MNTRTIDHDAAAGIIQARDATDELIIREAGFTRYAVIDHFVDAAARYMIENPDTFAGHQS